MRADVPLALVKVNYVAREVTVRSFLRLSGDEVADFARIAAGLDGAVGCKPGNASPIRLLDASVSRADTIVK